MKHGSDEKGVGAVGRLNASRSPMIARAPVRAFR